MLSDNTIKSYLKDGTLILEPLEEEQIQPASVDLRLGDEFLRIDGNQTIIETSEQAPYVKTKTDEIVLMPQEFLLATTIERVGIPNGISAFLEGRSSIGRLGLFIHNAGFIDTGFEGQITLELYNANKIPIAISAGMRICQIVFFEMDKKADNPYSGKYQGQKSVWGSLSYIDFSKGDVDE